VVAAALREVPEQRQHPIGADVLARCTLTPCSGEFAVVAPRLLHRVRLRSDGGREVAPTLCAHAGGGANAVACAWELLAGVVEAGGGARRG
jgi:hypothetical protein